MANLEENFIKTQQTLLALLGSFNSELRSKEVYALEEFSPNNTLEDLFNLSHEAQAAVIGSLVAALRASGLEDGMFLRWADKICRQQMKEEASDAKMLGTSCIAVIEEECTPKLIETLFDNKVDVVVCHWGCICNPRGSKPTLRDLFDAESLGLVCNPDKNIATWGINSQKSLSPMELGKFIKSKMT